MTEPARKSLFLSLQNIYETFAISAPTVLEAFVGRVKKEVCDDRLEHWAAEIAKNAEIDLEVVGRQHVMGEETFIVMSNHQSLYDIPVLFHALGKNLRMVTKTELFKVPIFGPAMKAAGFIEIDRGHRQKAIESLDAAKKALSRGVHVWIAPEGTRSKTGELLPFKKGGFAMAMDSGLRILPVTLRGTRDVLTAKGVRSIKGQHVRVTFHAPIDPAPYAERGKEGREALMRDVKVAIESGL